MARVVVGMSGGVDSAAACSLLKKEGYEVIGVTLRTWQGEDGSDSRCCEEWDARRSALALEIPYYAINCEPQFKAKVVEPFLDAYLSGRTPNPCTGCNRQVKWQGLMDAADRFGADYVATGHYAKIVRLSNGRYTVRPSETARKDQSYMLYQLTQEQLSRTLFPLGDLSKDEVRRIAKEAGIPVFDKPDSQEICFISDEDYTAFIEAQRPEAVPAPGNFVDAEGRVLGQHKGIIHYTIGQRRGLGLPAENRCYVTKIRPDTNEVVIGSDEDLYTTICRGRELHFMALEDLPEGESVRVFVKIRYQHRGEWARVTRTGADEVRMEFEQAVRAPAPGQSAVFYTEEGIAGGATIAEG